MAETVLYAPLTPVEWLERDYDDWKIHIFPYDGAIVMLVRQRRTYRHDEAGVFANGPGHDQMMIRLKTDSFCSDEDAGSYYWCHYCAAKDHICGRCSEDIPHMAGGYCAECWDALHSPAQGYTIEAFEMATAVIS